MKTSMISASLDQSRQLNINIARPQGGVIIHAFGFPPKPGKCRGEAVMSGNVKSMTLKELESVIAEGCAVLEGRRILEFRDVPALPVLIPEDARTARRDRFLLLLEDEDTHPRIVRLLICLRPDLNYMLITPRPQPRSKKGVGSVFARRVHSIVKGGRLLEIEQSGRDRIASLVIETREGRPFNLVVELFGRHPNLLLLDEDGTVTVAYKDTTAARAVRTGAPYPPPPRSSGGRRAAARILRFAPAAKAPPGIALNTAADLFFKELEDGRILEDLRTALKKNTARGLRRIRARIATTERRIAKARDAETIRKQADLLKAHFHLLRRGMEEVEVPDILSGDEVRAVIPLDPTLDPAANLDAHYKRYRKLVRSITPLQEELQKHRKEKKALDDAARDLENAGTLEEVTAIGERLASILGRPGASRREPGHIKRERHAALPAGVRRFRTTGGRVVLVGRDGETNHRLLQLARGRDLWLHCQGVPGAHVVIPLEKDRTASLDLLLDAGLLAVHFSRVRGSDRADVAYTPRKYVRAVKGGKKGQVTVERFKTLLVEADPPRLEALLAGLDA
jgi:predicted ribosome quality control (RQC) complex YloA/Tae2 family protein